MSEEEKAFLLRAAHRHNVFNYGNVALLSASLKALICSGLRSSATTQGTSSNWSLRAAFHLVDMSAFGFDGEESDLGDEMEDDTYTAAVNIP